MTSGYFHETMHRKISIFLFIVAGSGHDRSWGGDQEGCDLPGFLFGSSLKGVCTGLQRGLLIFLSGFEFWAFL